MQLRKRLVKDPDLKLEKNKTLSMYKTADITQTKMKSLEGKPDAEIADNKGIIKPPRKQLRQKGN